ncbi:hypothetical protein G5714_010806 [Onychostoma macrolepis]|uniref:Uncharacterized protein n=1 Tax=Onychostoma macrolepis TaxID=369639 RepID=A0A7J6CL45_9TELE|nr:hypothetical protein G5714_010806 [Onychostoma macrolepis]
MATRSLRVQGDSYLRSGGSPTPQAPPLRGCIRRFDWLRAGGAIASHPCLSPKLNRTQQGKKACPLQCVDHGQSFPGSEHKSNMSMDSGAGGRDSGDGTLYMHGRVGKGLFPRCGTDLHQSEGQEANPKKSAILSVIEGHSLRHMPKTGLLDLPSPLTTLYASTRLEMNLPALLEEGAKTFDELHLTPEQVVNFIRTGILPELLGKWFTVPRLSATASSEKTPVGCYCGKPVENADNILSCTSEQCKRKHFHKSCLMRSRVPKTWTCLECKKLL